MEPSGRQLAVAATRGVTDQRTIEEAIRKLPASSEKARQITKAIWAFTVKDLCPYSVRGKWGISITVMYIGAELHCTIPTLFYRHGDDDTLQPNQKSSRSTV